MDPLELAWLEYREEPETGGGSFAAVAVPRLAALLGPDRDPHVTATAATDAVLDLMEHPDRFDPARGGLIGFLFLIARRDLLNLRAKEARHHRGRAGGEFVELAAAARNEEQEVPPTMDDYPELREAIAELPPADRAVLELMRRGERATAAFVTALDLAGRPAAAQAAEVKRAKDRIIARLKRAGRGT